MHHYLAECDVLYNHRVGLGTVYQPNQTNVVAMDYSSSLSGQAMSQKEGGGSTPSTTIDTVLAEDSRRVMLRLSSGEDAPVVTALDTTAVEALITALGAARSQMLEPVPDDFATLPVAVYDPRWRVGPDNQNSFATFAIRHPGFGWSIFGFPRHEAGNIAKWLRKVTTITSTRDTQSDRATSFGGDTFLLTTEGLGFYYYGKGEKRIGPNPFEQVEFDSDRAAAIVAGSIAETRLEQAVQSRLRETDTSKLQEISTQLFRPSGALGPFSTKIDLAYLMRLLSDEAYKDLTNIKNIRNDFAHKLDHDSFDVPSIRDRCKNFMLVDRHVGPVPDNYSDKACSSISRSDPYMGLPDYQEKLADPRFRYTMTAQLISSALEQGSENPDGPLPLL